MQCVAGCNGMDGPASHVNASLKPVQEVGGAPGGDEMTPFGQIGINAQVSVTFDLSPK